MVHYFACNQDTAVTDTKQGKVRGYVYDGITIFKGIPYAKAKRFHAPEPVEPWEGVLETVNYGYVCPLLELPKPNGELNVPHRYWVMPVVVVDIMGAVEGIFYVVERRQAAVIGRVTSLHEGIAVAHTFATSPHVVDDGARYASL